MLQGSGEVIGQKEGEISPGLFSVSPTLAPRQNHAQKL